MEQARKRGNPTGRGDAGSDENVLSSKNTSLPSSLSEYNCEVRGCSILHWSPGVVRIPAAEYVRQKVDVHGACALLPAN